MKGKVWKFGNDIDTDIILPGRYLIYTDEEKLSEHCMEGLVSGFKEKVTEGDFILGGTNFGCGSSREHAPIAIKGCGISAVIAESFARIFKSCVRLFILNSKAKVNFPPFTFTVVLFKKLLYSS